MDTIYHNILKEIRPTHAVIDLAAIEHNIKSIRGVVGNKKIMTIVKANGYGHGIQEVAQKAIRCGSDYIGVGFLEEGLFLRQNDIEAPILVMGGILGYQVKKFVQNDLEITVSSLELAKHINDNSTQKARVHLKIDTGMERIGVGHKFAVEFVRRAARMRNLELVGMYSHFATADEADNSFAKLQLERFQEIVHSLQKEGIEIPLKHIANSGALLEMPESHFEMVRPGILTYGILPSRHVKDIDLKPAMSLKSKVVFIKRVPSGTGISYGLKFTTSCDTNIVTVPIGYGDGYSRLLTGKSEALIAGKRYPIVGTICMDQLMVDVGEDKVEIGEDVILIGRSGQEEITAIDVAERMGTIPYEVTCMVNARVPRIHIHK